MAGYRKTSKYTPERNSEINVETLAVLVESTEPLTIDEIKSRSMELISVAPQKMARILSELNDKGFVRKSPNKAKGKMVYMAVSVLQEQGYDMNTFVC